MDEDQSDEKLASDSLLHSSRHGDLETVQKLITQRENGDIEFDINCKGKHWCKNKRILYSQITLFVSRFYCYYHIVF